MVTVDTWADRFLSRLEQGHAELTDLDQKAGDGDFGDNMRGTAKRARALMADGTPGFTAISQAFRGAGGTSGPLFSMWFRPFARQVEDPIQLGNVASAARAGLDAIQSAAGAQVGDNTMVDALVPATDVLEADAIAGVDLEAALAAAASRASDGAESTVQLLGRKGRSSYVGEHARGVTDPGALTVAWFFDAALDV